jgi:hypothetical protein
MQKRKPKWREGGGRGEGGGGRGREGGRGGMRGKFNFVHKNDCNVHRPELMKYTIIFFVFFHKEIP